MELLRTLLLNYKIPGVRNAEIRHRCAKELSEMTQCTISVDKLQYKNDFLYLSVPPLLKSAIRIKEETLIKSLSSQGIVLKGIK